MSRPWSRPVRAPLPASLALLLAVTVALAVGGFSYLKLSPLGATATGRLGDVVRTGGVSYRLDDWQVAVRLPAEDSGDPPVHGPDGSVIVLVTFTETVTDHTEALDGHFCDFTLRSGDTSWEPDGDYTYGLRRRGALSCGDTDEAPLRYDRPKAVAVSFVIPAGAADGLVFRIATDSGRRIIDLRR